MKKENRIARVKNRMDRRSKQIGLIRSKHHRLCIILLRVWMFRLSRRGAALSSPELVALEERISQHSVMLEGTIRQRRLPQKQPFPYV